jgi:hypothetical protein
MHMSETSEIKWAIAYLILLLLIFGAQSYFLYFEYMPNVLAPYVSLPDIHAQVQKALYSMVGQIRFWFLALAGSVTGLIIGLYVAAKKNVKK